MVESRFELMASVHNDAVFGAFVAFGMGGIFAELYDDIAMRPVTLVEEDVDDLVGELST